MWQVWSWKNMQPKLGLFGWCGRCLYRGSLFGQWKLHRGPRFLSPHSFFYCVFVLTRTCCATAVQWSPCSVTCSNGTEVRCNILALACSALDSLVMTDCAAVKTRSCTSPVPQYNGTKCTGPTLRICATHVVCECLSPAVCACCVARFDFR